MKNFKFSKSAFWDLVIRNTIALEFAILFVAFIKVLGDGGLKDLTFLNLLYGIAITFPCAAITALVVVIYEKRTGK